MSAREQAFAKVRGVLSAIIKSVLWFSIPYLLLGLNQLYYAVLPGSWFLEASDVKVASSIAGKEVPFDWCRQPRHGAITADATRTFYRRTPTGQFSGVSQYKFQANIEPTADECQSLSIKPSRQPQIEGTYYFRTDLHWKQNGYDKDFQYKSNTYFIGATADSLRQRIKELEEERDALKVRLSALQARISTTRPATVTGVSTSSTVVNNQPTTSAPPDPGMPTPAPQEAPMPAPLVDIRPLLQGTVDTVRSTPLGGLL